MKKFILNMFFLFSFFYSLSVIAENEALPEIQTENGISYLSGGIGEDEVQAMQAVSKDYNLLLTFAEKEEGAFLADVIVTIYDMKGNKLLEAEADGPKFFAKLPNGRYKVSAEVDGKVMTKIANLTTNKRAQLVYLWAQSTASLQ